MTSRDANDVWNQQPIDSCWQQRRYPISVLMVLCEEIHIRFPSHWAFNVITRCFIIHKPASTATCVCLQAPVFHFRKKISNWFIMTSLAWISWDDIEVKMGGTLEMGFAITCNRLVCKQRYRYPANDPGWIRFIKPRDQDRLSLIKRKWGYYGSP